MKAGELAFAAWSDQKTFEYVTKEFDSRENILLKSVTTSFDEFCKAFQRYMPTLLLVSTAEVLTEKFLRVALEKVVSKNETEEMMNTLNIPLRDNYYRMENYDLLTAENLKDHVKKYEWLLSRYGDRRTYSIEDAQNKLLDIDKQEFFGELQETKQEIIDTIDHAKELLGKQSYLVDIFQYIVFYRTQRSDVINRAIFQAFSMLELLAREKNLSYEQFLQASFEEVLNDNIPMGNILESRKECCAITLEDDVINCYDGVQAKEIEDFFYEEKNNVEKISGTIASKGIITGNVKIVLTRNDFNKIENGDILVTSMTTVDMIPIMKIANAFVTDEGVVTCHAAIVSREMKKPCVIGTKIATQVLRDGDLVEVDANNGIVKILKK